MSHASRTQNFPVLQPSRIYRRIEDELKLTHVAAPMGIEGNERADRMAMRGAQSKEKKLHLYQETMDIPTLLKMRPG